MHREVGETELVIKQPPPKAPEGRGISRPSSPPVHSEFSNTLLQVVFRCFLTLHSLLSSRHTSSFSVPHQGESVDNWKLWVICSQCDAAVSALLIPNGSS